MCQRIISAQKLGYDLYYSLTHPLKWKPFGLETYTCSLYLVLNFYQINRDGEIRTRDHLIIKALIPCQRIISTQKFKFLCEISWYNLYYSLTKIWNNYTTFYIFFYNPLTHELFINFEYIYIYIYLLFFKNFMWDSILVLFFFLFSLMYCLWIVSSM